MLRSDDVLALYSGRVNSKVLQIDARTGKGFTAIYYPLENRNGNDNGKRNNTVVYILLDLVYGRGPGLYVLMLSPVTGRVGGKMNKTVVKEM